MRHSGEEQSRHEFFPNTVLGAVVYVANGAVFVELGIARIVRLSR